MRDAFPTTTVALSPDDPRARHLDTVARGAAGFARTAHHAESVDRTIRAHARATGQDPAGYVVLTPGSPEHARAERDLMRARAL